MSSSQSKLERLRNYNAFIRGLDPKLADEGVELARKTPVLEALGDPAALDVATEEPPVAVALIVPAPAPITTLVALPPAPAQD